MTNEGKRTISKVEFENSFGIIDDDIERLISTNFGLKGKKLEQYGGYLSRKITLLTSLSHALYFHIKMANGLFPTNKEQLSKRQMHQKYAAGACYGIVTVYERIFHYIGISRDKHIEEIKHIQKELKSIKTWRENDKKRFQF